MHIQALCKDVWFEKKEPLKDSTDKDRRRAALDQNQVEAAEKKATDV